MSAKKLQLMDFSKSHPDFTAINTRSEFHISGLAGFVFLMLVTAIVSVGIIVHFAVGKSKTVYRCEPGTTLKGQTSECSKLASQGNKELCEKCPAPTSTHIRRSATQKSTPCSGYNASQEPISNDTSTEKPKLTNYRLPTALYPLHYNVELQPYMTDPYPANFTFKGKVKIWMRCDQPSNNVTLHILSLEVDNTSLRFYGDFPGYTGPYYLTWSGDKDREFFILNLDGYTEVGKTYVIEMSYTSPLKDDLFGLYYSTYTRNGQTVYMVATQFQGTFARKAFPCFDEPAMKATFNITLVRPSHLISLSNMPIINNSTTFVEEGVTYVKDVYAETKQMSTYLLAFVISDFSFTQDKTKNGITYRAWSRPEIVRSTEYALEVGVQILSYFEEFFNQKFPLPKQDMIAIPDLNFGAMENWGLIFYREVFMLYTSGISNEANKELVATVVSHELAHMWFGDLVTPKWWDDLWLNEGFATFVQYLGLDTIHPEWKMFQKLTLMEIHKAFNFDGLVSSHPLYAPVGHPDEVIELFDDIPYAKGASVIRMMRHFLGYTTFQKGMNLYLSSKVYSAASHTDLWASLTEQARLDNKNINVKEIMDTWTLQMNYPVVSVSRDCTGSKNLMVHQERFLINRDASEIGKYVSPFNYSWSIPLTFASSLTLKFDQTEENIYWLWKYETSKTFEYNDLPPSCNDNSWFICNVQQNGYYRVNYELSNWQALIWQLKTDHTLIPVINRAQLINDAWNLVKSGYLEIETAFSILAYLKNEREFVPWKAAKNELDYLVVMLARTPASERFQVFMQKQLETLFNLFGMDLAGASHTEIAARALIAAESCKYGIPKCLKTAKHLYETWMNNSKINVIDPNLRISVYCAAIWNGGVEEWEFALKMYNESDVASEKLNLLTGLSCSNRPSILQNYLNLILANNSCIRKQDAADALSLVASSSVIGRYLAWDFFRSRFQEILNQFGSSPFHFANLITGITSSFNTEIELEDLKMFKASHEGNFGAGASAMTQAVEKVEANIMWMEKYYKSIDNFVSDQI